MSKEEIARGFAPAGMMECWNTGIMGLQIQKYCATISPMAEDHKGLNRKYPFKPNIPSFHYSRLVPIHIESQIYLYD
jgi:hypothetical protein